ncbi:MAG: TonB-dependent receptor [Bacteroidaceae bacterium]|nr:TonB-dependent receptor [Bacteroidaceae bacterium]
MSKGVKLMAAAFCLSAGAYAQIVNNDTLSVEEFDFSLTEGQIDEDAEAASTITTVQSTKDPYLNEVGYTWSAMRFKYRALDNAYVGNYINGVKFNNVENGRFSFSGITGGLNDATRNKTGATNLDQNDFSYSPLGGATNIDIHASHYAAGNKAVLTGTNRNYKVRASYTYASGLLSNGWAFMGSLAYRYASEGVIEGTFYNSFSFMLGAEKIFNKQHSLSFNIWGAPTERGQQGAATEEAYALANSHYYNPYWGYYNGEKRNSRVVTEFSPSFLTTWTWKMDEDTKLSTSAAVTWMNYASTALSYNNAYNPRPDYYKNMPSSAFNVYSDTYNNDEWLSENPGVLDTWQTLYDHWTGSKANRQVQWDLLYAQNEANNATGKNALYYLEKRHNNQLAFNLSSILNGKLNDISTYNLGINLNSTKGMHYKTMADLLGATTFYDYDNYSLNKYGSNSVEYQNDLDNPNRSISKGDKFGYNYNIYVTKANAFAHNEWKFNDFTVRYGANIEGTWMEREGLMRNGRAANYSKGKSGVAKFLGGGGKILLEKKIATSRLYLGGAIQSQAPLAYNAFTAPRIQNNFIDGLKNEWFWNVEAGYQWYFGPVSGKIGGYYTKFNDKSQQTAFYNDDASYLTYLSMTGIEQEFKGLEAAITIKLARNLKLNLLGTLSDAKYTNNPNAQLSYEGSSAETVETINAFKNQVTGANNPLLVFMKNVKIDSTPLTAASIGLSYNTNGWYFDANLNYYDRVYIGASKYLRLSNSTEGGVKGYASNIQDINVNTGGYTTAWDYAKAQAEDGHAAYVYDATTGEVLDGYSPTQEKFKGGFMLDASIGKSINLRDGKRLSVNLQVQNITNNTDMRTGGYEENRADRSYDYIFSKNSHYYYANAINAFLNVSLKF